MSVAVAQTLGQWFKKAAAGQYPTVIELGPHGLIVTAYHEGRYVSEGVSYRDISTGRGDGLVDDAIERANGVLRETEARTGRHDADLSSPDY